MDNKEEKSEISQLHVEKVDEHKATKSEEINNIDPPKTVTIESDANTDAEQVKVEGENSNDQVIIDPPKVVTIKSDANTDAEQVKDEEENNKDQVIIDPPKVVTIESDANTDAEQVKDEKNNNVPGEGNKNEQVEKERIESSKIVYTVEIKPSEKESKCRPIAFLLGLPFALVSLVIAFIGGIIWIIGFMLTFICPCCFCVTVLVEMALALVNAPFQFFQFIIDKIPF